MIDLNELMMVKCHNMLFRSEVMRELREVQRDAFKAGLLKAQSVCSGMQDDHCAERIDVLIEEHEKATK